MVELLRPVRAFWTALPRERRIMLVGLVGLLLAGIAVLYSWSSKTPYTTLYTGLDATDAGRITAELTTKNVPFQLAQGGSAITVPQAQADQLRVQFATEGLPRGGKVGYELFDGNSFSATDFVQRLNFQRALEGELSRTIESFGAVQRARVHLVMPEKSLFVQADKPSSASVVVQLRPGNQLKPEEVQGVAKLVSGAVEGLLPEHVTVLDSAGAILFDGVEQQNETGTPAKQLVATRAYEQTVERDLQNVLNAALGPGKSRVLVRATLNFDRVETNTESFTPGQSTGTGPANDGVKRSTTSVQETYAANGAAAAGQIPGAVANVPGANQNLGAAATPAANGANGTNYNRSETTTNFEVSRTAVKRVEALGNVQRQSVSILFDESVPETVAQSLQASVGAAAGINKDRGDTLVASRFAFDATQLQAAQQGIPPVGLVQRLTGYLRLGLPLPIMLIGFMVFRRMVRSVTARSYRVIQPLPSLATAGGGTLALGAGGEDSAVVQAAVRTLPELRAPDEQRSEIEERVANFATAQPQAVADVVQAWLKEEERR